MSRSFASDSSPATIRFCQPSTLALVADLHELIGVADRVLAHGHELADVGGRIGKAQPVLDVALVLADLLRELAQRVAERLGHLAEHRRLLERRDVLALEVLDDADLERRLVVELGDDGRDRLPLGHTRRTPAPLAGDELELRATGSDEDRLEHAVLADRVGELGQRLLVVGKPRLGRVRQNLRDRHFADLCVRAA